MRPSHEQANTLISHLRLSPQQHAAKKPRNESSTRGADDGSDADTDMEMEWELDEFGAQSLMFLSLCYNYLALRTVVLSFTLTPLSLCISLSPQKVPSKVVSAAAL